METETINCSNCGGEFDTMVVTSKRFGIYAKEYETTICDECFNAE